MTSLIFRAWLHQLERFRPTFDDSINRKGRRLAALVRAIELSPVNQSSAIIHYHGIGFLRRRPAPLFLYLILQAAGRLFLRRVSPSFSARNFSPSLLFFSAASLVAAAVFSLMSFENSIITCAHFVRSQSSGLRPAHSVLQARSQCVSC